MADKDYCGIVFIGGGSSWAWAGDPEKAAKKAAKICKSDWKHLFKFQRKQPFKVNVLDMREREGWYADHRGIMDQDTHEQIPVMQVIEVTV